MGPIKHSQSIPANRCRWWAPINPVIRVSAFLRPTHWTTSAPSAHSAKINCRRPATARAKWSATRTWTNMGRGGIRPTTEWFGCPTACQPAGRGIILDIGCGLTHGDGPGWMTHPGVLLRFTMDVWRTQDIGPGVRVPWHSGPSTLRHWLPGWVETQWVAELAGLRWVRARFMCPPIAPAPLI